MSRKRASIGEAMFLVALACVDLALMRWFVARQSEVVLQGTLIVVAIQVGLWLAIRGPARARWFWVGFLVAASVWPVLLAVISFDPESSIEGSWPFAYLRWSMNLIDEPLNPLLAAYGNNIFVLGLALAVASFIPQAVMASFGGLLSHCVVRPVIRRFAARHWNSIAEPHQRRAAETSAAAANESSRTTEAETP